MATCYRHPTRETGVACSNCGRPICTDCMTPTPVGMRCPECAKDEDARPARTRPLRRQPLRLGAERHRRDDRDLRDRLRRRDGLRRPHRRGRRHALREARAVRAVHRVQTRVLPDDLVRLPALGILHILFNMWFIWVLGNMLEPAIGKIRFTVLYIASLLCGAFGALLLEPNAATVGASGAAFGLLGAAIVEARARGIDIWASGLAPVALINFALHLPVPGDLGRRSRRRLPRRPAGRLRLPAGRPRAAAVRGSAPSARRSSACWRRSPASPSRRGGARTTQRPREARALR